MSENIVLKVGFMNFEDYRERTMNIVRGLYKVVPGEPKIWFTSLDSLAKILSEKNRMLLDLMRIKKPQSLQELSVLTGRDKGNLSKTLKFN